MAVADETMVLDCYRLAKFYAQSPEVFLRMPISEAKLHLYRTVQLDNLTRRSPPED